MSALQRTVPRGDNNNVPVGISETLSFHVAGLFKVFLNKTFPPTKRCQSFSGGGIESFGNLFERVGNFEAPATTTVGSFDGHGHTVKAAENSKREDNFSVVGSTVGPTELVCDTPNEA
jgi:hypothetical protein